ncbi:MAG: hypothetical protein FWB97_10565 [Oscillospiraceae bacterium]|nr:hypothetical protein [Oscillospiraceae bacterium]
MVKIWGGYDRKAAKARAAKRQAAKEEVINAEKRRGAGEHTDRSGHGSMNFETYMQEYNESNPGYGKISAVVDDEPSMNSYARKQRSLKFLTL